LAIDIVGAAAEQNDIERNLWENFFPLTFDERDRVKEVIANPPDERLAGIWVEPSMRDRSRYVHVSEAFCERLEVIFDEVFFSFICFLGEKARKMIFLSLFHSNPLRPSRSSKANASNDVFRLLHSWCDGVILCCFRNKLF
jgi:hypothetical protein